MAVGLNVLWQVGWLALPLLGCVEVALPCISSSRLIPLEQFSLSGDATYLLALWKNFTERKIFVERNLWWSGRGGGDVIDPFPFFGRVFVER